MNTVQTLKKAKALLTKKGWFRGYFARDAKGLHCDAVDQKAACFCAYGAIQRASQNVADESDAVQALMSAVPQKWAAKHGQMIPTYNDAKHRTKAQILAWFDRAIANVKAESGAT